MDMSNNKTRKNKVLKTFTEIAFERIFYCSNYILWVLFCFLLSTRTIFNTFFVGLEFDWNNGSYFLCGEIGFDIGSTNFTF